MYDLVDSLTFKLRSISPTMWPIFEFSYQLFKNEAIDFLDGKIHTSNFINHTDHLAVLRDAADSG